MNSTPTAGLAGQVRRRPLTAFLVLGLVTSYSLLALMALAERGVLPGGDVPTRLGADMGEAGSFVLVLSLLASALLVTYVEGGRDAVASLLRRAFRWRVPARWWAAAVVALPLTSLVLALALGDRFTAPSASTLAHDLFAGLVALLLINLAEETAWAGFVQTRLERGHRFFGAALLTGPVRPRARTHPGDHPRHSQPRGREWLS